MNQFGGKDSKRHFTVVINGKENGLYVGLTPSSAAKKVVTKLCTSNKGKKVEFYIREITQGSKKKTYGPYEGHLEKLKEPIELKGRVIKYKPVVKLIAKKSVQKGGEPKIVGAFGHRYSGVLEDIAKALDYMSTNIKQSQFFRLHWGYTEEESDILRLINIALYLLEAITGMSNLREPNKLLLNLLRAHAEGHDFFNSKFFKSIETVGMTEAEKEEKLKNAFASYHDKFQQLYDSLEPQSDDRQPWDHMIKMLTNMFGHKISTNPFERQGNGWYDPSKVFWLVDIIKMLTSDGWEVVKMAEAENLNDLKSKIRDYIKKNYRDNKFGFFTIFPRLIAKSDDTSADNYSSNNSNNNSGNRHGNNGSENVLGNRHGNVINSKYFIGIGVSEPIAEALTKITLFYYNLLKKPTWWWNWNFDFHKKMTKKEKIISSALRFVQLLGMLFERFIKKEPNELFVFLLRAHSEWLNLSERGNMLQKAIQKEGVQRMDKSRELDRFFASCQSKFDELYNSLDPESDDYFLWDHVIYMCDTIFTEREPTVINTNLDSGGLAPEPPEPKFVFVNPFAAYNIDTNNASNVFWLIDLIMLFATDGFGILNITKAKNWKDFIGMMSKYNNNVFFQKFLRLKENALGTVIYNENQNMLVNRGVPNNENINILVREALTNEKIMEVPENENSNLWERALARARAHELEWTLAHLNSNSWGSDENSNGNRYMNRRRSSNPKYDWDN